MTLAGMIQSTLSASAFPPPRGSNADDAGDIALDDISCGLEELLHVLIALGAINNSQAGVFHERVVDRLAETLQGLDDARDYAKQFMNTRYKTLHDRVGSLVGEAAGGRKAVRKFTRRHGDNPEAMANRRVEYEELVLEAYHQEQSALYAAHEFQRAAAELANYMARTVRAASLALVDGMHAYLVSVQVGHNESSALLDASFPRWEHLCGALDVFPQPLRDSISEPPFSSAQLLPDGLQGLESGFSSFFRTPDAGATATREAHSATNTTTDDWSATTDTEDGGNVGDGDAVDAQDQNEEELAQLVEAVAAVAETEAAAESTTTVVEPPPGTAFEVRCRALYAFDAGTLDELSFAEGDTVLWSGNDVGGWGYGLHTESGREGFFPVNYVDVLSGGDAIQSSSQHSSGFSSFDFPDVAPSSTTSSASDLTPTTTTAPAPAATATTPVDNDLPPPLYSSIFLGGNNNTSRTQRGSGFTIQIPTYTGGTTSSSSPNAPTTPRVLTSDRSALLRDIENARYQRVVARTPTSGGRGGSFASAFPAEVPDDHVADEGPSGSATHVPPPAPEGTMSELTRDDLLRQIRMTTAASLLSPPSPPPPPPLPSQTSAPNGSMLEALREALMRRRSAAAASTRTAAAGSPRSLLEEIRNFDRDRTLTPASTLGAGASSSHTLTLREQLEHLMNNGRHPVYPDTDTDTFPDTESFSSDW